MVNITLLKEALEEEQNSETKKELDNKLNDLRKNRKTLMDGNIKTMSTTYASLVPKLEEFKDIKFAADDITAQYYTDYGYFDLSSVKLRNDIQMYTRVRSEMETGNRNHKQTVIHYACLQITSDYDNKGT